MENSENQSFSLINKDSQTVNFYTSMCVVFPFGFLMFITKGLVTSEDIDCYE